MKIKGLFTRVGMVVLLAVLSVSVAFSCTSNDGSVRRKYDSAASSCEAENSRPAPTPVPTNTPALALAGGK